MKRPVAAWLQILPFGLVMAGGIVVPILLLLVYSFRESSYLGIGPGYTLDHYTDVLQSTTAHRLLRNTLFIGFGVSSIVTLMAFVTAYGIKFRMGRSAASTAMLVVLATAIASYLVRVFAWGTILGTNGLVNAVLLGLGLVGQPLGFLLFGYFAIFVTMASIYLPIGILIIHSALEGVDGRTIEASKDLGVGSVETALRVVLPQAVGGVVTTFVLVAILSCWDYIAPSLVGGIQGQMVGMLVRDAALSEGNYPAAAALAFSFILVMLAGFAAVWAAFALAGRLARLFQTELDRVLAVLRRVMQRMPARRSLSRPLAYIVLAYLILPVLVVLVFSFNAARNVGLPWQGATLAWYREGTTMSGFLGSLTNSLEIMAASVLAALTIGSLYAFGARRLPPPWNRVAAALTYLPYVIPAILIGVVVSAFASDGWLALGKTTTAALHTLILLPIIILVLSARLDGMDARLGEAARDLGSAPSRVFTTVTLPLIAPALTGAALIAAASSIDELFITTFSIGTDATLPTWLYGQARRGFTPAINALAVLLMAGTLLMFLLSAFVIARAERAKPKTDSK